MVRRPVGRRPGARRPAVHHLEAPRFKAASSFHSIWSRLTAFRSLTDSHAGREDRHREVQVARAAALLRGVHRLAGRLQARLEARRPAGRRREAYQEVRHRIALCRTQISRRFSTPSTRDSLVDFPTGAARRRAARRPEPPAERLRGVPRLADLLRGARPHAARRRRPSPAAARPRSPARRICRNSASCKCMW